VCLYLSLYISFLLFGHFYLTQYFLKTLGQGGIETKTNDDIREILQDVWESGNFPRVDLKKVETLMTKDLQSKIHIYFLFIIWTFFFGHTYKQPPRRFEN
jgi:hypothetical protein